MRSSAIRAGLLECFAPGSSAQLLSGEIVTFFAGHTAMVRVHPLRKPEDLGAKGRKRGTSHGEPTGSLAQDKTDCWVFRKVEAICQTNNAQR